ncbi:MAG: hypothetical protein QOE70_6302 [Chthoniobacter sp.]|jgi:hypothetical protein|nr:hypothetical protein [Chthoniobacter sp.]
MNRSIDKPPLFVGLRAARANLIPGLVIQTAMLAIVLAYYWHEPTKNALNLLAVWKERYGYLFSVLLSIVAGAVLPEVLKILFFQRGKVRRENIQELIFATLFWGVIGAVVDTLYRLQAVWFGTAPTFSVLLRKVVVDQFVYCPLFAAPTTVWAYEWKNRSFSTEGISDFFTLAFYRAKVLPTLIASWGVWIPVVTIIYSLPSLFQVPLFGLALSFWVLLVTYITSSKQKVWTRTAS